MDVREKLVELLNEAYFDYNHGNGDGYIPKNFADYFISNGVTVQECGYWVSLTNCANAGVYCSVCHKKVYKEDYARCNRKNKLRSDYCPHCGAKMMPPAAERREQWKYADAEIRGYVAMENAINVKQTKSPIPIRHNRRRRKHNGTA